jgi:hypothetical protein
VGFVDFVAILFYPPLRWIQRALPIGDIDPQAVEFTNLLRDGASALSGQ